MPPELIGDVANDPVTLYGLGAVAMSLVGMLGWVLRETITYLREGAVFIKANTEALQQLRSELGDVRQEVREVHGNMQTRPCALQKGSAISELLAQLGGKPS